MNVWHVELLTWKGIAAGASHYMADLRPPDGDRIEVTRPATLNDIYRDQHSTPEEIEELLACTVEHRFPTRLSALNAAIEKFHELSEDGDVLLRGSHCSASPQEPLVGPESIVSLLSELYGRFEELGRYDGDYQYVDAVRSEVDAICNDWNKLINSA